jgi:peptide-methionine (R)-S-oxide reductase
MNGGRRAFLIGGAATLTGAWFARRSRSAYASAAASGTPASGTPASGTPASGAAASGPAPGATKTITIEEFSPDGKSLGLRQVAKVMKSEAEWRTQLSPLAFQVARQAGTEYPFSGEYDKNHARGLYRCVCCDTALYDSSTKFDSGTGWPSFYRVISRYNVAQAKDWTLGMSRDAVSCTRCDAHLGHVFDDGPKPTGLRYCMNSVSLRFVAYSA